MTHMEPGTWTALVVEDDPAIRDLLASVLNDLGFAMTSCDRGRAAVQAICQRHFDLILLDLGLPDLDGLHVCEVARAVYDHHAAVLVISADRRRERRVAALACCDDFIGKPFNLGELEARIAAKLRRLPKGGAGTGVTYHRAETSGRASLAAPWTDEQKREIVADYRRDGAALCPDCAVVLDTFPARAYHGRGHALLQCHRCKQGVTTSAVEGL